jgi:hypothetical protein
VICAGDVPDHVTISRFHKDFTEAVQQLFAEVLVLCRRLGLGQLGVVALDGSKFAAPASTDANRTEEGLRKAAQAEEQRQAEREQAREQARQAAARHAAQDAEEDARFGDGMGDEMAEDPSAADDSGEQAPSAGGSSRVRSRRRFAHPLEQQSDGLVCRHDQPLGGTPPNLRRSAAVLVADHSAVLGLPLAPAPARSRAVAADDRLGK